MGRNRPCTPGPGATAHGRQPGAGAAGTRAQARAPRIELSAGTSRDAALPGLTPRAMPKNAGLAPAFFIFPPNACRTMLAIDCHLSPEIGRASCRARVEMLEPAARG